jgi:acetolactate synthase-1/2/3 large subunit
MVNYLQPPRIAAGARLIQIDIDPTEISRNRHADVALVGDARAVLEQLRAALPGRVDPDRFAGWREQLAEVDAAKRAAKETAMSTAQRPIHPLRLCREVRDQLDRDAVLVVDGHETLNFARQSIPSFVAGHRLNSGTFGHMGVGLPYAIGARVAAPECQVVALVGDGSLGMSVMELDTAVRHRIAVRVVVSNNGGWTSSAGGKPGRDLGVTAYHRIAEALGCHAEHVDAPEAIAAALRRAFESAGPALVNVAVDPAAHSQTASFARYEA